MHLFCLHRLSHSRQVDFAPQHLADSLTTIFLVCSVLTAACVCTLLRWCSLFLSFFLSRCGVGDCADGVVQGVSVAVLLLMPLGLALLLSFAFVLFPSIVALAAV